MYSFSCLVLERIVEISALEAWLELCCVITLVFYFSFAQAGYILHGMLQDTDNQFEKPHRLGKTSINPRLMKAFMVSLIIFEICAFVTLLVGALDALA